jgi:hypothetical protein
VPGIFSCGNVLSVFLFPRNLAQITRERASSV